MRLKTDRNGQGCVNNGVDPNGSPDCQATAEVALPNSFVLRSNGRCSRADEFDVLRTEKESMWRHLPSHQVHQGMSKFREAVRNRLEDPCGSAILLSTI